MPVPPSGEQYDLHLGEQSATVVEAGGGIRSYRHGDRDVLHPYDVDALCDGGHGAVLVPWPNRLADGRYRFDGHDYELDITEADKHNAIHGLLRWQPWQAIQRSGSHVVMVTRVAARKGYPWTLDVAVRYELTDAGLVVTTSVANRSASVAPLGIGHHPYLSPGEGTVDGAVLQFAAGTRIETDAERQLPTGRVAVPGTPFDFAAERAVGDTELDYGFTDLERDADGRAWLRLTGADGRTVQLWAGAGYDVLEVYTADTLAPDRRRHALAVEPMTCPPNAFATGEDLLRVDPGETVVREWGVGLLPA
ncbi:aldose 1-epimerase family protein [Jatrophihabitans endophyticus]|uniref:aldose 1-epimerase family protein n=1 Tax=Jatrophihabitans endophyticus TaxID=1206085 RepID=UPI0019F03875|nr:aldose 1-epimerase family protein [Jatrophihabitans endophyticus]MBE7188930.1 aldose 1-epimerase family protein [Jatrophihabitans endophyticus]